MKTLDQLQAAAKEATDLAFEIGRLRHFSTILRDAQSVTISCDKSPGYLNVELKEYPDLRALLVGIIHVQHMELTKQAERIGLDLDHESQE